MEGLKVIPLVALVLAISGIVIGASVISLSKFGDTQTKCWNSSWTYSESAQACHNATSETGLTASGPGDTNLSYEMYALEQAQSGESELSEQLPTIAVISIMVVIISIIAGVFVYMRYFG